VVNGNMKLPDAALELIGASHVRVYYRGWDEWGNTRDTPITHRARKP
jgi:3-mercaptopyruvate sulfurtransferase SseA